MKKRRIPGRPLHKLAINKDKLQVLSQEQVLNVNGGGNSQHEEGGGAPPKPPGYVGEWY